MPCYCRAAAESTDGRSCHGRVLHCLSASVQYMRLKQGYSSNGYVACRTKLKARVQLADGSWAERIPAWTKWATQEWNEILFNGVYYQPEEKGEPGVFDPEKEYVFKYPRPQRPRSLRIYECHVGMSSEEPKVNSYLEFRDDMIPRIRKLGYNCIQIMAIQVRRPGGVP